MRKVIQISVSETDNSYGRFALCDDGSIWEWKEAKVEWVGEHEGANSPKRIETVKPARWVQVIDVPKEGDFYE